MGWVTSKWGASDTGRKARFYTLTRAGKKQLEAETANWARAAKIVGRFIGEVS